MVGHACTGTIQGWGDAHLPRIVTLAWLDERLTPPVESDGIREQEEEEEEEE